MTQLRDYQQEALNAILSFKKRGVCKQLIVLPTGSGKTVIFSQIPRIDSSLVPMLVLAHRSELLQQAKEKIGLYNPELVIEIEQAENVAGNVDIVVASVQTLGRSDSDRIFRFDPNYFKSIVIDEAHHAAAPSYKKIIDYFNPSFLLGVTATPQRGDSTRLVDVFQEIVYYKTIKDLIKQGWLAKLVGYRITTNVDLTNVEVNDGDFIQSQLEDAVNNNHRNKLVVDTYMELCRSKKTLVFAAGINHAKKLLEQFKKSGVFCDLIVGETPQQERHTILQNFRNGTLPVLINVGVLTEGFDEPSIQAIILARPTKSNLLYTQIVGRGTRTHKDKDNCLIVDICDVTKGKKPLGLPTLLGLPPDFNLQGKDLLEVAEQHEKLQQISPVRANRCLNPDDIKINFQEIDLFMPVPPSYTVMQYSKLIWSELSENVYRLMVNDEETLTINQDALGRWTVLYHTNTNNYSQNLGNVTDIRQAFAASDAWVQEHRPSSLSLLDSAAAWRSDSPTPSQIRALKKIGITPTPEMTKGFVSQILSKHYEKNPRPAWLQKKIKSKKSVY
jgi:ATP-dependent helicase IRC3